MSDILLSCPAATLSSVAGVPVLQHGIAAPAAVLTVSAGAPTLVHEVPAPAGVLTVSADAPVVHQYTLTLLEPADAAVVPTVRPVFLVAVQAHPDATVNLAVMLTFPDNSYIVLTGPPAAFAGPVPTALSVDTDLTPGTYTWRAFLITGATWSPASPVRTFTVDPSAGTTTTTATVTVDGSAAAPWLWGVWPDAAAPGAQVTCYGLALPTGDVTASLAGVPATVTATRAVPATAQASTAERTVDLSVPRCDPAHVEIDIQMPVVPPPGGPLYLEGD